MSRPVAPYAPATAAGAIVKAAAVRETERRPGRATIRIGAAKRQRRRREARHPQQGDVELRIVEDRDRIEGVAAERRTRIVLAPATTWAFVTT